MKSATGLGGNGSIFLIFLFMLCVSTTARSERNGEFYFSWGYNTEWYTNSNLYINQPSLGNDLVFQSVAAHDRPGWDNNLFNKAPTIPQYNYRIGYFFNKKKNLGVELNFDH